jgi:glutaredoxin
MNKEKLKKVLKFAGIAFVVLLILIQFIPVAHTNPPVTREIQWDSLQTRALAQRACFDCHSNETVWPWYAYVAPVSWRIANHVYDGRRRLNFSEWDRPNENEGAFSRENLKHFATELGLDTQQFNQCLDSDKYRAKVQGEIGQAEQLGVRSTPTLFVNGQLIRNGSDYQVLQSAITAALKSDESG